MPGGLFGRSRPRDLTVHVNPARTGGPVVDPEPQMSTMTVSRHITSAPKETAVNLFFYYFFYLLLMASAVITIIFAQRPSSNFDQTFDVQSLPGVIFAWNRDAAVTPVSAISSGGDESVESATCTPTIGTEAQGSASTAHRSPPTDRQSSSFRCTRPRRIRQPFEAIAQPPTGTTM